MELAKWKFIQNEGRLNNKSDDFQDEDFKKTVLTIIDEDVIMKFKNREGNAEDFYDTDDPPSDK